VGSVQGAAFRVGPNPPPEAVCCKKGNGLKVVAGGTFMAKNARIIGFCLKSREGDCNLRAAPFFRQHALEWGTAVKERGVKFIVGGMFATATWLEVRNGEGRFAFLVCRVSKVSNTITEKRFASSRRAASVWRASCGSYRLRSTYRCGTIGPRRRAVF